MYGFYEETQKKYGSLTVWKLFNEVFDYLPLAALVNRNVYSTQKISSASTEGSLPIFIRSKKSMTSNVSARSPLPGGLGISYGPIPMK